MKFFFSLFLSTFLGWSLFLPQAWADWVGPTQDPPNANRSRPIDISIDDQTKAGRLTVSGGLAAGGGAQFSVGADGVLTMGTTANFLLVNVASGLDATNAMQGRAVYGHGSGHGVYGESSGDNYAGVYGTNTGIGWAGYFNGPFGVTGNSGLTGSLSVTGGVNVNSAGSYANPSLYFQNSNNGFYIDANRLMIKSSGAAAITFDDVGIRGNGGDRFRLMTSIVATDVLPNIVVNDNNRNAGIGGAAGTLSLITSGISRLKILSGGNVGVGTTNPGYKLDVQGGQVNASGGLCINGDCKNSWAQVGTNYWTDVGDHIYANNEVAPSEFKINDAAYGGIWINNNNLVLENASAIYQEYLGQSSPVLIDDQIMIGRRYANPDCGHYCDQGVDLLNDENLIFGRVRQNLTGNSNQNLLRLQRGDGNDAQIDKFRVDLSGNVVAAGSLTVNNAIASPGDLLFDVPSTIVNGHLEINGNLNATYGVSNNGGPVSINGDLVIQGGGLTGANSEAISIGETDNVISFILAGVERMRITSNTVGIGTESPNATLEVRRDIVFNPAIIRLTDVINNPEFQLQYANNASDHWSFYVNKTDGVDNDFKIWNGSDRLTILRSNGNVGIGTANPQSKLDVVGDIKTSSNVLMGWEKIQVDCAGAAFCQANCSAGKKIIGGGCNIASSYLRRSYPIDDDSWYCAPSSAVNIAAYAICARMGN